MRHSPRVLVLSAMRAADYEPQDTAVCVSITDPDHPDVPLSGRFAAILRLRFSDIDQPSGLPEHTLFNRSHARTLLNFLRRWSHVDTIVVHCRAGLSRSPAIAIALAELNGLPVAELEKEHPLWNKHVRATVVAAARHRSHTRATHVHKAQKKQE